MRSFYGEDAIVRDLTQDPRHLRLHVETNLDTAARRQSFLAAFQTHVQRVALDVTQRGTRVSASARSAYENGVVL